MITYLLLHTQNMKQVYVIISITRITVLFVFLSSYINCFVLGMLNAGIGEQQVNNLLSAMNVPGIHHTSVKKRERKVSTSICGLPEVLCEALEQESNPATIRGGGGDGNRSFIWAESFCTSLLWCMHTCYGILMCSDLGFCNLFWSRLSKRYPSVHVEFCVVLTTSHLKTCSFFLVTLILNLLCSCAILSTY